MKYISVYCLAFVLLCCSCKKNNNSSQPPIAGTFAMKAISVNGMTTFDSAYKNLNLFPVISINFSAPLNESVAKQAVSFSNASGATTATNITFQNSDSTLIIQPSSPLQPLTKYIVTVSTALQSKDGGTLQSAFTINLTTAIDSTDKFPRIADDALLDLIQKQTFNYFWNNADATSGMAHERNDGTNTVTTGGTGFGVMAMIAAVNRGFISRADAVTRITTIAHFLQTSCTVYHGAFSHWIDGATGATIPFSPQDDGADLVETSYLMQGLLCARQYFNTNDVAETSLRTVINQLWDAVDWNWFRQNNQNVLYWHWSPNYGWAINVQIQGWNEALIVYALAASSRTSAISKAVYDEGWARNGAIRNGKQFYDITLPLGEDYGGPLFFAQYSFLGINPHDLTDAYTDYWMQNTAHTFINYNYCITNPAQHYGYSDENWGLTASDEQGGYSAHSPTNDNGTISPAAAISSMPYDTAKSMAALRFFYYKLGDKLWGTGGFKDAFNLDQLWFADSYLAIDQGPEIVMIENARSGLLWNLFMSCPEVKAGMKTLGFQSPYFN